MFSDKTGTLTCNLMEFKKFSVGKYSYGRDGETCKDAAEREVTNFNCVDEVFERHMKDEKNENH